MTSSALVRIEPATTADVPVIFELIRELATFERLLNEVVATEDALREHLFGPRSYAEVVLAKADMQVVGFALFFHNYSTFRGAPGIYLEDLFVRAECRGRGYGAALLRHVAKIAVTRGCGRFEWSVLDWNQRAIDFYRGLGAEPMKEWTIFRVEGAALEKLGG